MRTYVPALVRRNAIGIAAIACACPAIAAGLVMLLGYANTPGPAGASPAVWPQAAMVQRTPGRPTLVVFAHPECACTRATVSELARIMATRHTALDAVIHVVLPAGAPREWSQDSLGAAAAAIPGVQIVQDRDGVEARRFGAVTSGQTLLYDAHGRLAFSGGITASRGHEGDSAGRDAILHVLAGGTSARAFTPVFGCILVADQ